MFNPKTSLERLILKLQFFGHLLRRVDSLGKTMVLGKVRVRGEGSDRGRNGWMALLTQWTKLRETVWDKEAGVL